MGMLYASAGRISLSGGDPSSRAPRLGVTHDAVAFSALARVDWLYRERLLALIWYGPSGLSPCSGNFATGLHMVLLSERGFLLNKTHMKKIARDFP